MLAGSTQNSKLKIKNSSRARRDGQHLPAFVESARRADAVGNRRGVALRAFAQLRQFENTVVSAAHMLPARGRFAFWNTHKFSCLVSVYPARPTPMVSGLL